MPGVALPDRAASLVQDRITLINERIWASAASFSEYVMSQKEAAEREREDDFTAALCKRKRGRSR